MGIPCYVLARNLVNKMELLGISDPWIWGGYVLCIVAVAFCCTYGYLKSRGPQNEEDDEDGQ